MLPGVHVLAALLSSAQVPDPPPANISMVEQVHLALGTEPSTMSVQWASKSAHSNVVRYGTEPSALHQAASSSAYMFDQDPGRVWYNHVASMVDLQPSTKYFYQVGSGAEASPVFHFRSQVTEDTLPDNLPQRHVIYGDLGTACAFTLCPSCTCNLTCDAAACAKNHSVGLVTEVGLYSDGEDDATMILHVGDFAYNMDDDSGRVGDQFFRNIEQLAAYVPYMVSIGNHENEGVGLAHFTERFRLMPTNSGTQVKTQNGHAPNNWYFSWDDGLVHYVAISTELYSEPGSADTGVDVLSQHAWLKEDLSRANDNRQKVPWIVVHGHRSLYCSCDSDCDAGALELRVGLEKLLFDNGVDLFLNGHEHNYERNWPTYRGKSTQSNNAPNAPIYIVTGAAGCTELHEPFTRKQPGRSAFRSNNFGYSRFIVHNHTHAHWQQIIMDPTSPGPPNADSSSGGSFFGKSGPCDGEPHTCQNMAEGRFEA